MRRATRFLLAGLITSLFLIAPTFAESDIEFRGWGPRVGLSDDPDQVVGGVHFHLGEFAPNVFWQPSVDIGFGDDVTTLTGNVLVAYRFRPDFELQPYVGGQLTVAFYDIDDAGSETEIGPAVVGGFETAMGETTFLLELQLGFGDIPDTKLMAGWRF